MNSRENRLGNAEPGSTLRLKGVGSSAPYATDRQSVPVIRPARCRTFMSPDDTPTGRRQRALEKFLAESNIGSYSEEGSRSKGQSIIELAIAFLKAFFGRKEFDEEMKRALEDERALQECSKSPNNDDGRTVENQRSDAPGYRGGEDGYRRNGGSVK